MGVDLAPTDPDRWLNLILFLVQSGQLEDAEKVIPEAEKALPKDKAPLYLARCCGVLGLAYQEKKQEEFRSRSGAMRRTPGSRRLGGRTGDPSVTRAYTEYLIRTGQIKEVESQLTAILARTPTPENADEISWARRILAAILLNRNDFQASRQGLALFEPTERQARGARDPARSPPLRPEDLRTLARVYAAQGTARVPQAGDRDAREADAYRPGQSGRPLSARPTVQRQRRLAEGA